MQRCDYVDVVGGGLLLVLGLTFSWYAIDHYELGTLRHIGPAMYPMGLGLILSVLGTALFVPAFFRKGFRPQVRLWAPLFILLGVAAFALTIRTAGLLPAIVGVTIISSFAELEVRPARLALLCCALCAIAWLVFIVGLGMAIPLFRWPF